MATMSYPVQDTNPIQIFPAGTQKRTLTVFNMGSETVYVADNNAGQPHTAVPIAPKAASLWESLTPLYAFCAAGKPSQVMVTDTSVQTTNPSVKLDGDVALKPGTTVGVDGVVGLKPGQVIGVDGSIQLAPGARVLVDGTIVLDPNTTVKLGAPVSVTGGGQLLVGATYAVSSATGSGDRTIPIPLPATGAVPAALKVIVQATAGTGPVGAVEIGIMGTKSWTVGDATSATPTAGVGFDAYVGCQSDDVHTFVVPVTEDWPANFTIRHRGRAYGSGSINVTVFIYAQQTLSPFATSEIFTRTPVGGLSAVLNPWDQKKVLLPSSFSPYVVRFRPGTLGNLTNVELYTISSLGVWQLYDAGLHVPSTYKTAEAGVLGGAEVSEYVVGGTGRAQYLLLSGTNLGRISIHPRN